MRALERSYAQGSRKILFTISRRDGVCHPHMIRVALSSQDFRLQPLLAPALGREFHVMAERNCERLKEMFLDMDGTFDVLLLDLDANCCDPEEGVRRYQEISETGVPVVVLTDDSARPTGNRPGPKRRTQLLPQASGLTRAEATSSKGFRACRDETGAGEAEACQRRL